MLFYREEFGQASGARNLTYFNCVMGRSMAHPKERTFAMMMIPKPHQSWDSALMVPSVSVLSVSVSRLLDAFCSIMPARLSPCL